MDAEDLNNNISSQGQAAHKYAAQALIGARVVEGYIDQN
jgi:hypothetical protein